MFLHWDFMHLLMNMIWLYWFGQIFMEFLGARKLLATYLLGGFAGAFLYCLSYNTLPLFSQSMPYSTAMGASASIMAITIATATLLPDYRISLLFIGEVRLKWVAVVILFLDLINISSSNAGGHIAHLGGALYGFVFIRLLQRGTDISAWLQRITFSTPGTGGRLRVVSRSAKSSDDSYLYDQKSREQELDRILDKISKSGYGSLTAAEREFLTRAGNEK
jgi:membrane associated rhomboid family serine protease